jgi:zinc protease
MKRRIMKINIAHLYILFILFFQGFNLCNAAEIYKESNCSSHNEIDDKLARAGLNNSENVNSMQYAKLVAKKVLSNGLTVLVREMHNIPKVAIQMWYNVGSKDEKTGEKGIAHLIEHMIFKGTQKLSETDINIVSHMLSGNINAFTSYDYTGYLFNLPTHHWQEALPIIADCMTNCTFKDDHLNSEMKAVIQELKMYRDDYTMSLMEDLIGTIFPDHPYHFPIIGYKQDLWSVHGADLKAFYKKHYLPNNATLVVVGDVHAQDVFDLAEKYFGSIVPNKEYKKEQFYHSKDIVSKSVTLYRDVKLPVAIMVYLVPGIKAKKEHILEVAAWVLGLGKSSRLYKKIVDELQLATSLSASYWDLFDYGLFLIDFEPKSVDDIPAIEKIINDEIASIVKHGLDDREVEMAVNQAKRKLCSMLEKTEKQAYQIGKHFVATGDENYIYNYLNSPISVLKKEVVDLFAQYLRPSVINKGIVLPLPASEHVQWDELQKLSDEEDKRILSARIRDTPLEEASYAKNVVIQEPERFDFPKPSSFELSNGVKVLYYDNQNGIEKIDLVLELKADAFYGPEAPAGLYNFVMDMLLEGTENYTATELAQEVETLGMSLNASPGFITMSMLSGDLKKGLEILTEILTKATFKPEEIEKTRAQILANIQNYWDEPSSFADQLIREQVYKNHPYSKNTMGTEKSIKSISRKDLVDFYNAYITPIEGKFAIVGDLKNYDLQELLEETVGKWAGRPAVADLEYSKLKPTQPKEIDYPINRDQVLLCYAGLSVDRMNPDYDKFLLFDQVFGGGALRSLHSRLFTLREQSGLFYTINGSLIARADKQPGMILIKTIVSLDRLQEAEHAIKNTIKTAVDSLTQEELVEARRAIINSMIDNFQTNGSIAYTFLWLDRFKFPADFFDTRNEALKKVTLDQVKEAVKHLLAVDTLATFRIGRVGDKIALQK